MGTAKELTNLLINYDEFHSIAHFQVDPKISSDTTQVVKPLTHNYKWHTPTHAVHVMIQN